MAQAMQFWWQHLLSFIIPITLSKHQSTISDTLHVLLYRGQVMLATQKATYSYGTRYNPFKLAWQYYKLQHWPLPNTFLLLGGGLCSALQSLYYLHKQLSNATIVELDPQVIQLAKQYLPNAITDKSIWHKADAWQYIIQPNLPLYDAVGIDVFIDMDIPLHLANTNFIEACYNKVAPNGVIIINTYFNDPQLEKAFNDIVTSIIPQAHIIKHDVNKIYIARKVQ
jgi:spermidine synthase